MKNIKYYLLLFIIHFNLSNVYAQNNLIDKACVDSANVEISELSSKINSRTKTSSMTDNFKNVMILSAAFADAVRKLCNPTHPSVIEIMNEAKQMYEEAKDSCIKISGGCDDVKNSNFSLAGVRAPSGSANSRNTQNSANRQQQQADEAQSKIEEERRAKAESQASIETNKTQQARADTVRKGKRRDHEPENEAHECIEIDRSSGFGAFVNRCNFRVSYTFCNQNFKENSWASFHTCDGLPPKKHGGNSGSIGPNGRSGAHVKGAGIVQYFACKDPAWALDPVFEGGQLKARCKTV
jgi:F0F1-type ATP synthase epsilon subunit